ncbi:MAG: hypothetical protein JETT_3415 [Candidatus Jettenia ecosi]|uniref:Uncharacterized protein n=1 Tax=Candidatus Jettenia ecosi TaxID=2494326 RepID=A0A533Q6X8_9BACT|nr:MAG: hypothetical protein JETT_3415 [Candidatus Jettenia ecosi]
MHKTLINTYLQGKEKNSTITIGIFYSLSDLLLVEKNERNTHDASI